MAFHYDADNHNPHCHILLTMRMLECEGFASAKCKEWQPNFAKVGNTAIVDGDRIKQERESWAKHCNAALVHAGSELTVDHRTLKQQNIERSPTFHIGKDAWHHEKRTGLTTNIGERLKHLVTHNQAMQRLKQWTNQLQQANPHYSLKQHLQRAKEAVQQWALHLPTMAIEPTAPHPYRAVQTPIRSHEIIHPRQELER